MTDRQSEIMPLAEEACAEAAVGDVAPRYWKRTFFLNDCPLFKPMRISFRCEGVAAAPASAAPVPAQPAAGAGGDSPDLTEREPLTGTQGY